MERKHSLVEGEIYHAYSRGVEKRITFTCVEDYERFLLLLLLMNSEKRIEVRNVLQKYGGLPSVSLFEIEQTQETDRLTDIVAYALMPNHFHLVLRERRAGGISRFMLKLLTSYSMYFNTKYERTGPLFARPYRSRHVESDEYLRWLLAYIYVNPLELHSPDWKDKGLPDREAAAAFLQKYRYSSFADLASRRPERAVLSDSLPFPAEDMISIDPLIELVSRESSL